MKNFLAEVFPERLDPDPVCSERLDPDPVCPARLDPDSINIRLDPKPYSIPHTFRNGILRTSTNSSPLPKPLRIPSLTFLSYPTFALLLLHLFPLLLLLLLFPLLLLFLLLLPLPPP